MNSLDRRMKMERSRKVKLMWRWSLISSLAITFCLLGLGDKIAELRGYLFLHNLHYLLMSYWWDIALGPICSIASVSIIASKRSEEMKTYLVSGMVLTLIEGLILGIIPGLIIGVMSEMIILLFHSIPSTIKQGAYNWLIAK